MPALRRGEPRGTEERKARAVDHAQRRSRNANVAGLLAILGAIVFGVGTGSIFVGLATLLLGIVISVIVGRA